MTDARDLRLGLRAVAHALNRLSHETRRLGYREHLRLAAAACDKALVDALGADHLSEAAAHCLLALEARERQRAGASPDRLRETFEARRAR